MTYVTSAGQHGSSPRRGRGPSTLYRKSHTPGTIDVPTIAHQREPLSSLTNSATTFETKNLYLCVALLSLLHCILIDHALLLQSKWVVLATAATVVLIWRDHDQVLWASTGSVLNSASSKILKKIFNQQRPLTAVGLKADPGMPSSHAQSLGFLALYAAFGGWSSIL